MKGRGGLFWKADGEPGQGARGLLVGCLRGEACRGAPSGPMTDEYGAVVWGMVGIVAYDEPVAPRRLFFLRKREWE